MNQIRLKVPAKINLALDITDKRSDGYHMIKTVFQTVSIYDYITIQRMDNLCSEGFTLFCNRPRIPCGKKNIVYKAGKILENFSGKNFMENVCVNIEKNIPSGAGMGGGSADAAAAMYGLNKLFELGISIEDLCHISSEAGADVPFFFVGGTAYAEGIGDIITPAENNLGYLKLIISKGKEGISTAKAYKAVDCLDNPYHPDAEKITLAMKNADMSEFISGIGNIFTKAAKNKEVADIINDLLAGGAEAAEMTGSGSAVFGIFNDPEKLSLCLKKMKKKYVFARECVFVDKSIEII